MRWTALLPLFALTAFVLPGCNTVKGFGTDVHDIAQNVQIMFEADRGYVTDARTPSPTSASRAVNRTASTR